jgi:hypothetical protein
MKAVGINGYGTIGKIVADTVNKQNDMKIGGVTKRTPNFNLWSRTLNSIIELSRIKKLRTVIVENKVQFVENKVQFVEKIKINVIKPKLPIIGPLIEILMGLALIVFGTLQILTNPILSIIEILIGFLHVIHAIEELKKQ